MCIRDRVTDYLENRSQEAAQKLGDLTVDLDRMWKLARTLERRRQERGGLDFDVPEPYFKLDERGWPTDVYKRPRSCADRLIESFMLAANESVARYLADRELAGCFRVHEEPDGDKLSAFTHFLDGVGLRIPGGKPTQQALQGLLHQVEDQPEEGAVNRMMLRAMHVDIWILHHLLHHCNRVARAALHAVSDHISNSLLAMAAVADEVPRFTACAGSEFAVADCAFHFLRLFKIHQRPAANEACSLLFFHRILPFRFCSLIRFPVAWICLLRVPRAQRIAYAARTDQFRKHVSALLHGACLRFIVNVYKAETRALPFQPFKIIAETPVVIPVSYTHLDVYKRQVPASGVQAHREIRYARLAPRKHGSGNRAHHRGKGRA